MRRKYVSNVWSLAWGGLLLLASVGSAPTAQADAPALAIRLAGGGTAVYPVSEIQRIGLTGDTLVVAKAGGSDSYPVGTITRIDFLLQSSGISNPRDAAAMLKAVHLFQNQPNPFSPKTRIAFDLPQAGPVALTIYTVNGRLIRRLVKDPQEAGRHIASWDGRDDAGERMSSGIYFYQLTAPGVEESRRMILLP